MSFLSFCEWLAETPGSIALHESLYMYPLLESSHVLTLCLFVGFTVAWDFRLLGIGLKRVPFTEIANRLLPWMYAGFFIMVVTGILLFYAIPVRSYQNVFFRLKLIMLVAAGINAWVFHNTIQKRVHEWDVAAVTPTRARVAGALSLLLWAGIIVNGRMIAYNWYDCDTPQSAFIQWAAGCKPGQAGGGE
jgi:hypothetical protein